MISFSEGNGFEQIMERLLARVPDDKDKRQGSVIWDALAPAAAELAQCYIALDVYADQTYLENAVGENLDLRVYDYGVVRNQATRAVRIAEIYDSNDALMSISIGERFSSPNEYGGQNFKVIEEISQGTYLLECETAGTIGNEYTGELLPLTNINNLGRAIMIGTQTPGDNEESDEDLKDRIKLKINKKPFAGNKADYLDYVDSISGISISKIFPVWNGGGTVKVAFLTSDMQIPSSEFVNQVQTIIDPIQNQGEGIGIAPIGHTVTVEAPTRLDINVGVVVDMKSGYTAIQVQTKIENAIAGYIEEVQKDWENEDKLIIYTSRIIAAILTVPEVNNVVSVTINEVEDDLDIDITATDILFPMLNEVVVSEG